MATKTLTLKDWNRAFMWHIESVFQVTSRRYTLPLTAWYNAGMTPEQAFEAFQEILRHKVDLRPLKTLDIDLYTDKGCNISVNRLPTDAEFALLEQFLSGVGAISVVIGLFIPDHDRYIASFTCRFL